MMTGRDKYLVYGIYGDSVGWLIDTKRTKEDALELVKQFQESEHIDYEEYRIERILTEVIYDSRKTVVEGEET